MAVSGLTISSQRSEAVGFTLPFWYEPQAALVKVSHPQKALNSSSYIFAVGESTNLFFEKNSCDTNNRYCPEDVDSRSVFFAVCVVLLLRTDNGQQLVVPTRALEQGGLAGCGWNIFGDNDMEPNSSAAATMCVAQGRIKLQVICVVHCTDLAFPKYVFFSGVSPVTL